MNVEDAKKIIECLKDNDAFELVEASTTYCYYYDPVELQFCCLCIDGVQAYANAVHYYIDEDDFYNRVLVHHTYNALISNISDTMQRYRRFYALCSAEQVDENAIKGMLEQNFNVDLLIWDRDNHISGYMNALKALIVRRPVALTCIKLLLQKGANPNKLTGMSKDQDTPFIQACRFAHYEAIQLILPYVDVNLCLSKVGTFSSPTALMSCISAFPHDNSIKELRLNSFKLLLEAGADFNYVHNDGWSAIMKIIDCNRIEYFDYIPNGTNLKLNYFAKVNEFYHNHCTPLSYCVKRHWAHNNLQAIFDRLIDLGADINQEDGKGMSPLFYSVERDTIELFEKTHVNWHKVNHKGENALIHYAKLGKNKTKTAAYLLKKHVPLNNIDLEGNTALHYALENKDSNLALFLIEKGASYHIPNNKGATAHELAKAQNLSTVIAVIDKTTTAKIPIENLCIQILKEGFEYEYTSIRINYRQSDTDEYYYYNNPKETRYLYRSYSCNEEWLREYFCSLILNRGNSEEAQYFLNYLNTYQQILKAALWTQDSLKKAFEQSYLAAQIKLNVKPAEISPLCIEYLKQGYKFSYGNKEGYEEFYYETSKQLFISKWDSYGGSGTKSFNESKFKEICESRIELIDPKLDRMDFIGFFGREIASVLERTGYPTWRAWKMAQLKK